MRMLSRRYLLLGALAVPLTAHAQNWPAGNIKIVVVYPPGGSTDMIARLIQPHMQQRLGTKTVIIENRAGGAEASALRRSQNRRLMATPGPWCSTITRPIPLFFPTCRSTPRRT